jgi:hypothetical protein
MFDSSLWLKFTAIVPYDRAATCQHRIQKKAKAMEMLISRDSTQKDACRAMGVLRIVGAREEIEKDPILEASNASKYESRFEKAYGYFRPVIQGVVEKYLTEGVFFGRLGPNPNIRFGRGNNETEEPCPS